ncbi:MAG TPA: DUF1998 domain-containing protein, partial [Polyangiaceae bacterium]|nr:DUF1998 domain-containing protein [Polyangiaceae bacterium]
VALRAIAALALMCEPRDFGTTLGDASATGADGPQAPRRGWAGPQAGYDPTLFVYEHVPGGTGLAERMWEQRDVLLARTQRMVQSCPCSTGCPSCVGPGDAARKTAALELLGSIVAIT